jgi:RNA polymerase sigma factor (TIGR02999 family)
MSAAGDPRADVTRLLRSAGRGDTDAVQQLAGAVYQELRGMAAAQLAREAGARTLQPTALVHEAWLRLQGDAGHEWQNRAHFFGAAGEAMRRILVEQARQRAAHKRGGSGRREDLEAAAGEVAATPPADGLDLLALDEALARMEQRDPRMASIVKLRYFVGLSVDDAAAALDLSRRTVLREWTAAKAWLHRELTGDGA